jgi:hypothetical protein
MVKIAFLFLIIDNPHFPKVWDNYFKGHSGQYAIYIHPKYPDKTTWHKECIIDELHPTAWGCITRAYVALMRAALKDKGVTHVVTISESCVPIKPFFVFKAELMRKNCSLIKTMRLDGYHHGRLKEHKKNTGEHIKDIIKHYARFCLLREHVEMLLEEDLRFYHTFQVGDEFFLSSIYSRMKEGNKVCDMAITYDDWDYTGRLKASIKEKIKKAYDEQELLGEYRGDVIKKLRAQFDKIAGSPKTIDIVSEDDLERMRTTDSFFYRKFSKESDVEKHLVILLKKD